MIATALISVERKNDILAKFESMLYGHSTLMYGRSRNDFVVAVK